MSNDVMGRRGANTHRSAKLPALPVVRTGNPALDQFIEAVRERLEVREGSRGDPYERALTVRDLEDAGLPVVLRNGVVRPFGGSDGGPGGGDASPAFTTLLGSSTLFTDLLRKVRALQEGADVPDRIKELIATSLQSEAAKRGADIHSLAMKLQSEVESIAYTLEQITAGVDGAQAGIRQVQYASATADRATAGKITELVAALDGTGKATFNESIQVIADRIQGLRSQYMLKLNAGNAVAGITLLAEEGAEAAESAFVVEAGKFAVAAPVNFSQDTTPSATAIGQVWYNPVSAAYFRSTAIGAGGWVAYTPTPPFGVDTTTGTVFINGALKINANGKTAEELANDFYLTATGQVFTQNPNASTLTPASITLTAVRKGTIATSGTLTFASSPAGLLSVSGNTAAIQSSAFATNSSVKVTATLTHNNATYTDEFTLYKVVDGADALAGFLTNESHTLPANAAGAVSSYAGASGDFVVFKGTSELTTGVSYSVPTDGNPNGLTPPAGKTSLIDSVTGAFAIAGGLSGDVATITFRATIGTQTIDRVFTLTRVKEGVAGKDAASIDLSNESHGIPCNIDGSEPVLTGATTTATVYLGANDDSANWDWTTTVSDPTEITITGANSRTVLIASMGADTGYVDFTATPKATRAGFSPKTARFSFYKAKGGAFLVVPSVGVIKKSADGAYTPATVTFDARMVKPDGTWRPYSGRFKVEAMTGAAVSATEAATADATSYAYTVPPNITHVRASLYMSNSSTALLDQETLAVVQDGADGAPGTPGPRGSLTGYGSRYNIISTSWSDADASRVIYYMLMNSSANKPPDTTHLRIGDTVTLSDGSSFAATKYWNGSAWAVPGLVLDGNLLVSGSVAADRINTNGLTVKDYAGNLILGTNADGSTYIKNAIIDTLQLKGGAASSLGTFRKDGLVSHLDALDSYVDPVTNNLFYKMASLIVDRGPQQNYPNLATLGFTASNNNSTDIQVDLIVRRLPDGREVFRKSILVQRYAMQHTFNYSDSTTAGTYTGLTEYAIYFRAGFRADTFGNYQLRDVMASVFTPKR